MAIDSSTLTDRIVLREVRGRILRDAEELMFRVLCEQRALWATVNPRGVVPVDGVAGLVGAGGKRLRPSFCAVGFLAAGGNPEDPAIVHACAALEFLHAFALIHDDVLDDSALRRGVPTIHVRHAAEHGRHHWRGEARRFGEGVAILVGDLAYAYAGQLTGSLPPPARMIWDELITEMIIGQYLDVAVAAEAIVDAGLAHWIAVGKSGRYSIHRPLVLGAAIAGRSDLGTVFEHFGAAAGEAFQLRDDLIDAYGDSATAGKLVGQDLEQHKMTLLLTLAAQRDEHVRKLIAMQEWDVPALRAALDATGVRQEIETYINQLVNKARHSIALAPINEVWQQELAEMAAMVAYRDR